ncbi:hypothetical protein VQ042_04455 [Aurantimonas sp. A2-1-M11]|uniref:flagellar biosynthetic protein FliO n=1 Tax=Aurantimonas sp. A2-1-M11 TaxID=3113712 RepID=UPI002F950FE0
MPQWIVDLVGESLAQIVWVAIVAVIVCLLAMATIVLAKKAFGGRIGTQFKARTPRLAVIDVTRIDEKRRLVLVRRDETEHLILVGGQNDLLLEGSILRLPAAARSHGDWSVLRGDEPETARVSREHRHEPVRPAADERVPAHDPVVEPAARRETRHGATDEAPVPDRRSPSPAATPSPVAAASGVAAAAALADSPPAERRRPAAASMPEPEPATPPAPSASTPEPAAPRRAMATPTAVRAPEADTTSQDAANNSAPTGRIEPRFAAARSQPGRPDPDAEMARADLRAQINRSQSPEFSRVQDATAPAVAVSPADVPVAARQPLSVRSFATAIQQRKAPPEMPPAAAPRPRPASDAPTPGAATAAATSVGPSRTPPPAPEPRIAPTGDPTPAPVATRDSLPEPAAPEPRAEKTPPIEAERADPSLEDFLSAELDTDFGDDESEDIVAPGSSAAPAATNTAAPRPDDPAAPRDIPRVELSSRPVGSSVWPEFPKAEAAQPSPVPAPTIEAPRREPMTPPAPASDDAAVETTEAQGAETQDKAAPATADAPPERRLTLEEEMERLLGDFSLGEKGGPKPN